MKEKDYIEDLVLKNLDEINDNEPLEGHFERFEAKLKQQNKKKKINLSMVWKVAAAVVFVLLASNQAFIYFSPNNSGTSLLSALNNSSKMTLTSVSEEYEEVEFYYTNAIDVGITQWNSFVEEGLISEEEQSMMDNELAEFEELFKTLQNDLKTNPHDERVVNAMLEYYQSKLSVISMIITKLQEVKEANKNIEKETIL